MCSRPQFTHLTYMGGTRHCGPMTIIFGSVIKSWNIGLNIKVGVNRTFHVLKSSRPQYTDLTYMGGIGACGPMRILFDSVI